MLHCFMFVLKSSSGRSEQRLHCDNTQKQFSFRALSNSAPGLWNVLLQTLRESESSSAFHRQLNTHLFSNQWLHHCPFFLLLCMCTFAHHLAKRLPQYLPRAWLSNGWLALCTNHHHHELHQHLSQRKKWWLVSFGMLSRTRHLHSCAVASCGILSDFTKTLELFI